MTLSAAERTDLIRLARVDGVGPITFRRLLEVHGRAEIALAALPARMRDAGRHVVPKIPTRCEIEDDIARTLALGGRIIIKGERDYPAQLVHVPDAPPVLSIMGNASLLSHRAVGIVGARNASAAGIRMAEVIATELAAENICVISGLARGIDAAAHQAALYRGLTVAAIAGGLDQVYPPEHVDLQKEIAEKGCIVTEAPLGTIPQSRHFPRRNRLIAGMSLGCVIVEAALRSGTLITARLAAQYGREVFAVPGSPLDPRSRGGNNLLREGAWVTESVADILPHLPRVVPDPVDRELAGFAESPETWRTPDGVSGSVVAKVRSLLSMTPMPVDDVARRCQFSVSAVLAALSELELGGSATFLPGGCVVLLPEERR
ncbi:DNA processing protein DprA [Neoasaia chiangmaiensis NBRC 101099]|uniref:DNA processing protein DprA n=1 Tax=Neoasaia chiangmaiensis TaxID=320497 RepID=A0A1U9KLW5_9PROT|nr:DNA-processing protein DprA [Neoasaia chiangmaiensis]AQS86782.1 DNA processing protein DprA [Neoasaia chiangmaiensis]GBR35472.1 DNA processing protein DprA [Neoasaia chiangmaiensis NBRC 101099]GEN16360.1 DNA processing protein DprA [Neoasaia chiangmaiensis]